MELFRQATRTPTIWISAVTPATSMPSTARARHAGSGGIHRHVGGNARSFAAWRLTRRLPSIMNGQNVVDGLQSESAFADTFFSLSADRSPTPPRKATQTWVSMRATTNHKTFGTFCVRHYPRITQPRATNLGDQVDQPILQQGHLQAAGLSFGQRRHGQSQVTGIAAQDFHRHLDRDRIGGQRQQIATQRK